ncbi:hypothetical protein AB4Z52_25670 [Rhizobium sp. 2YAF20]|uniref:hypothetical protein n=1 Tax=Rhizobium sp. 2YAF20 TaxID=3233027 RepID=UPI003F9DDD0D
MKDSGSGIGETIPVGVIDTASGTVGVPERQTMREEVRSMREQVVATREALANLGRSGGNSLAANATKVSRETGRILSNNRLIATVVVVSLIGLLVATTRRSKANDPADRLAAVATDLRQRLDDLRRAATWKNLGRL